MFTFRKKNVSSAGDDFRHPQFIPAPAISEDEE